MWIQQQQTHEHGNIYYIYMLKEHMSILFADHFFLMV